MHPDDYRERFVDPLPGDDAPAAEALRSAVRAGALELLSETDGDLAVAVKRGRTVRLARTLGRPMRCFLAQRFDGPYLVAAEQMDEIRRFCAKTALWGSSTRLIRGWYPLTIWWSWWSWRSWRCGAVPIRTRRIGVYSPRSEVSCR